MAAVKAIAGRMMQTVDSNRDAAFVHHIDSPFAEFECIVEPGVSLTAFLKMLSRGATETEVLCAQVLLDRLLRMNGVMLTHFNAHRLFLAALMVAVKLERDMKGVAKYFSQIVKEEAVNLVYHQNTFLSLIDWEIFVSADDFEAALVSLQLRTSSERITRVGTLHRTRAAVEHTRTSSQDPQDNIPHPPEGRAEGFKRCGTH
eukprot:Hpha_TRINITY_DN16529_c1_g1::TRINITY_DN16529_c1_g1_i1::g.132428::m.132428